MFERWSTATPVPANAWEEAPSIWTYFQVAWQVFSDPKAFIRNFPGTNIAARSKRFARWSYAVGFAACLPVMLLGIVAGDYELAYVSVTLSFAALCAIATANSYAASMLSTGFAPRYAPNSGNFWVAVYRYCTFMSALLLVALAAIPLTRWLSHDAASLLIYVAMFAGFGVILAWMFTVARLARWCIVNPPRSMLRILVLFPMTILAGLVVLAVVSACASGISIGIWGIGIDD